MLLKPDFDRYCGYIRSSIGERLGLTLGMRGGTQATLVILGPYGNSQILAPMGLQSGLALWD